MPAPPNESRLMAEWLFTLNDQVRSEEDGAGAVSILSILRAGAQAAPGADVGDVEHALIEATRRYDRPISTSELRGMAENLAVPDLTMVRVVDGSGNLISEIPVANTPAQVHPGDRSENTHIEPENAERPFYS